MSELKRQYPPEAYIEVGQKLVQKHGFQNCLFCGKHLDQLQPVEPEGCQHITSFVSPLPEEEVMAAAFDLMEYTKRMSA